MTLLSAIPTRFPRDRVGGNGKVPVQQPNGARAVDDGEIGSDGPSLRRQPTV